jgi:phage protein D
MVCAWRGILKRLAREHNRVSRIASKRLPVSATPEPSTEKAHGIARIEIMLLGRQSLEATLAD